MLNCLSNNVTKGIGLLDKKPFLLYRKNFMQVKAFERYIRLRQVNRIKECLSHDRSPESKIRKPIT